MTDMILSAMYANAEHAAVVIQAQEAGRVLGQSDEAFPGVAS